MEIITGFYLLYVVLGSLLPFDLGQSAILDQPASHALGLPDVLSNIALYFPLGVMLHLVLARRMDRPILAAVPAVLLACVLSLGMEHLQKFSSSRVSSTFDVAFNCCGALCGVMAAILGRHLLLQMLRSITRELADNTLTAVIKAFCWVLVAGALMPFTPTLDASRLGGSVRSGTMVLFAQDADLAAKAELATAAGDLDQMAAFERDRMFLWGTWVGEALSFAVLGWLLHCFLSDRIHFKPMGSALLCLYLSSLLALLMSVVQIGILTRGFHTTDMLFRVMGALLGYAVRQTLGSRGPCAAISVRRWAGAAVVIAIGFIFFMGLAPFRFELDADRSFAALNSVETLPFLSYYHGRFDQVCSDFFGKALRFGFFALGMWMLQPVNERRSLGWGAGTIALAAMVLSAGVELAQSFIPSRVPSITDVIIAGMAACIATVFCQYTLDVYRYARRKRSGSEPIQTNESMMGLTDTLVASLIPDSDHPLKATELLQDPSDHTEEHEHHHGG